VRCGILLCAFSGTIAACNSDHHVTTPPPPTIRLAVSVVAGETSTCALSAAGGVYCWGSNNLGALGQGSTDTAAHSTPVPVSGNQSFAQLAGGGSFRCALTTQGQTWCWGEPDAFPAQVFSDSAPTLLSGAPAFASISVGPNHACGVTHSGQAYCWGQNEAGELGVGDTLPRTTPTLVSGGISWASLSVGFDHTCGLNMNGRMYCWGDGNYGAIGTFAAAVQTTPFPFDSAPAFASIHGGAEYTCGVTSGGAGLCWGLNFVGELGDGTTTYRSTPVPVAQSLVFSTIAASREDTYFAATCGLSTQGAAYCWGYASNEQLGDPSAQPASCDFSTITNVTCVAAPVPVSGGLTFRAIAVGDTHACGVTQDGLVYCWGQNDRGQLGTGTTQNSAVPVRVTGFGPS
jgi:alpha-tubulin suppressor-like RCC1 family protein